jgi:hypothetical protein
MIGRARDEPRSLRIVEGRKRRDTRLEHRKAPPIARRVQEVAPVSKRVGGQAALARPLGERDDLLQEFRRARRSDPPDQRRDVEQQPGTLVLAAPRRLQQRQRRLVARGGGQPGVGARVARAPEVVGDRVGVGMRASCQRLGHRAMRAPSPQRERPLVERLADERVGEADPRAIGRLDQQAGLDCPLDRPQQALLVRLRDRRPQRQRHLLADYCRQRQQPARLGPKAVQARVEHLAQRRGQADGGEVAERPAVVTPSQRALLLQRPQQLGDEEGGPLCPRQQPGGQPVGIRIGQDVTVAHERAYPGRVEAP